MRLYSNDKPELSSQ